MKLILLASICIVPLVLANPTPETKCPFDPNHSHPGCPHHPSKPSEPVKPDHGHHPHYPHHGHHHPHHPDHGHHPSHPDHPSKPGSSNGEPQHPGHGADFIDPNCPYHKYTCASKCDSLLDGDYRSCLGCDVYATCANGILYDNRPCPAGLQWSTTARACVYKTKDCMDTYYRTVACERPSTPATKCPFDPNHSHPGCPHHPNKPSEPAKPEGGNAAEISCPAGRAIKVVSALFGRLTEDVCPVSQYHHGSVRTDCEDKPQATKIASSMCDGKQSCSVPPTVKLFKDPCPGTPKYLKIYHKCVFAA